MSAVAAVRRVELADYPLDAELLRRVPAPMARRLGVLALSVEDGVVRVAMRDPGDVVALDELSRVLGSPVRALAADRDELDSILIGAYSRTGEIRRLAAALQRELEARREACGDATGSALDSADDAPVVQLLENVFAEAMQTGASDVHLQPMEGGFRIRYRVDGFLDGHFVDRPSIYPALVLRLKLMADMDIAERRLPQDGRLMIAIGDRHLHVRVATMPSRHGEAVVLRLANAMAQAMDLPQLGLDAEDIVAIERVLADPHGMLAVVGPTGSGKTTTLNALLARLDDSRRKLVTVEDPVECQLDHGIQVQVNPRIGLGFSEVLRSALRHDPDVLMVGEVRDRETAEISMRAALTGHLVLTTVHCNDAAACVPRLLDMGVAQYMLSSALRLVIAQRLLRRLCPHCSRPQRAPAAVREWAQRVGGIELKEHLHCAVGCNRCKRSGYQGRIGVYELLRFQDGEAVGDGRLVRAAVTQAQHGHTSIDEVLRVFGAVQ